MLKPPNILPEAAIFGEHEAYFSMVNVFAVSRKLLTEIDLWRKKNGGLLTYDEMLLGSLALKKGPTS
jgi:hypothetical protein